MNIDLKKEFEEKYNPIFIEDIYPGHPEKEQYFIACEGNEESIDPKFKEILNEYRPFFIIKPIFAEMLLEMKRKEKTASNKIRAHEVCFAEEDLDQFVREPGCMIEDEERIEDEWKIATLKEAMAGLPEVQRRRVQMRFFENMTFEKIAKIEKTNRSSIKRSVDIALETLRAKIVKEGKRHGC